MTAQFTYFLRSNESYYVCINQPYIRLNKVHNISVKVYVCARGVIYLMYWYVYFNLFRDLILQVWPRNQYLHLWSTTFHQFGPRLLSAMDCLWLDTCKQSSTALSLSLSPEGCLLCRCAVGGNWSLKPEIGCWSSSCSVLSALSSSPCILLRLSPPCSCSWPAAV